MHKDACAALQQRAQRELLVQEGRDECPIRTFASYLWNCSISGAMYSGEPHSVSASPWGARERAKPKSAILSSGVELLSLSNRF